MRTRSSSNLPGESSPNTTSSSPKRRNRRRSKQPFIVEESPVDTMADQRTMAELVRATTEGYAEAIMVPPIRAESKVRNSRNKLIVSQVKSSDANSSSSSEIAKLTHVVNQETSAITTAMTAILKQFQPTPPPAFVKAVKEICFTCGAAVNYNQGNFIYRPPGMANQIRPSGFAQPNVQNNQNRFSQLLGYNRGNNFNQDSSYQAPTHQNQVVPLSELEKIKKVNEINKKAMQTQINNLKNELRNEMKTSIQALMSNQTNELKNMMASFFQMNTASTSGSRPLHSNTIASQKGELKAITTRSGIILDGPSIPMPLFINPEEDERVKETLIDPDLTEYTIKRLSSRSYPKTWRPSEISYSMWFSELKCKAIADLGASIKLMPLSVWKNLGLPELIFNRRTLELANRAICTPAGIKRDVFVPVGKFTFLSDFVIVDYESDPRVPLILGRPFLRTALALIDVYGEEMILRGGDERLTLNMRHDTSSYSNQPQKDSINMINIYNDSCEDYLEDLFATNHLSGNATFSSHTDLTSPEVKDDIFDPEGEIVIIEKFINLNSTKDLPPPHNEMDSYLKDSVDEDNLANPNVNLFDTIPEMFTDEHALDYSSPPLYDDYYNDLDEFKSDNNDDYNDPFDSKGEKIKEYKLLIDELDLPRSSDFLPSPEYDSFLFEDFSEVDALPSTNNEDKVFNPGILIHENLFKVITYVAPDKNVKKIAISHASLILEDFDHPLSDYELPFHKEVPGSETLLLFSSENKEKVFKPGILTSKGVHTSLLPELSHRGHKVFKLIKILESPIEIFPCSFGEDIRILDIPCLHFYPP
nr:reverse transcriptase domain-containing protein [Tanacetum cinerariifolium]